MASRKKTEASNTNTLVQLFRTLVEFEPTEENPVTVVEMTTEMGYNTFDNLGILADAELIEFETGKVWLSLPDLHKDNAENIAREALSDFTPSELEAPKKLTAKEQAYKDRTQYNAAVSASQEPGAQHLHPMAVEPFYSPDAAADFAIMDKGEPPFTAETVRESVAVLREDATREHTERLPDKGLAQFKDAETGDMVYESAIVKNGLALDEPETVPPVPAGVTPNFWDLAHTAITQSARDYWSKVVQTEAEEYTENNGTPAPF